MASKVNMSYKQCKIKKNRPKKSIYKKKSIIIVSILTLFVILTLVVLYFVFWKPKSDTDWITGKYEQEFKEYTYICAFEDETGWNSVISKDYGSWALTACSCSYLEYRKYYGDKDLPKAKPLVGEFPNIKAVEVYDALSIFGDSKIRSNIVNCFEKEYASFQNK